jgi:hypothetical protein
MSMDKPYRVEVTVDARRDFVWRALTEPEQIRHWFGWDYDGLEEEIRVIFVEHATLVPPARIELSDDGVIELEDLGGRTLIRAIKPGDLDAAEWQDVYGDIEEGWITFFHQLRHRLARHPDATRRMIVLHGDTEVPVLPGEPWHESRYQRGAESDGALAIVFAKPGGEATLLVTTYDLDGSAFAAAEQRWTAWWTNLPTRA